MQMELVFVGSKAQTMAGFRRGFFALVVIAALSLVFFYFTANTYRTHVTVDHFYMPKFILGSLVALVLFSSALAVGHPRDSRTALAYGGLVALVVYGVANACFVAVGISDVLISLFDTGAGMVFGAFVAWSLFKLDRGKEACRTR
jgi:peptidoglycan/LPS O-acetylase OafA/YrhL